MNPGLAYSGALTTRSVLAGVAAWSPRRWIVAALGASVAALIIGVPTGIVPTSFYTRMTPVLWWNYPVWALSALLVGFTAATYVRAPAGTSRRADQQARRTAFGTVVSVFAVGCPICNKLVVAVLGVSGALSYWAPIQPVLGVLTVALLAVGLVLRLRGELSCRLNDSAGAGTVAAEPATALGDPARP